MTYIGSEYSTQDLFRQLKLQVKKENVHDYSAYIDLVDSLIEEKKSYGFFADEEDLEQIKRALELRWMEISST